MTGLIILGLILLAHVLIIAKIGFGGLGVTYVLGAIIWVFFPGYDTGLAGLLATEIVFVGLMAFGSLFPSGPKGIAAAGVGGYLVGRGLAKL